MESQHECRLQNLKCSSLVRTGPDCVNFKCSLQSSTNCLNECQHNALDKCSSNYAYKYCSNQEETCYKVTVRLKTIFKSVAMFGFKIMKYSNAIGITQLAQMNLRCLSLEIIIDIIRTLQIMAQNAFIKCISDPSIFGLKLNRYTNL